MEISKTPVDIKTLIQTSDINVYDNNKLIDKLKEHFSEDEQRLYVSNLFLYLNYHHVDDFVVNLETVWKFIGFCNKGNAKRTLENNFTENRDYKIIFLNSEKKQKNTVLKPASQNGEAGHLIKNLGGAELNKDFNCKYKINVI